MYWYEAELAPGSNELVGMTIHVRDHRSPGLALSSSPTRRLRFTAHGEAVLWARIESGFYGVSVVRRATEASPAIVPPVRADEARGHTTIEAWMRFFARALGASDRSPLQHGTWQLTELRPGRIDRDELVPVDRDGLPATVLGAMAAATLPRLYFEEWATGAPCRVFPLRTFSASDTSRVKAWRKHVGDGSLPPVLLWFVHGLEMAIVLDGHDRMCAALAEGVVPPVLVLWQVRNCVIEPSWREELVRTYEAIHERGQVAEPTSRLLNSVLIQAFRESWRRSITIARAVPDGDEIWNREVTAQLANDDPEGARSLTDE